MPVISFNMDEDDNFKRSELLSEGKHTAIIRDIKQEVNKYDGEKMVIEWELQNENKQKDNFFLWHMESNKRKAGQIKLRKLCRALNISLVHSPSVGIDTRPSNTCSLTSFDTDQLKGKKAIIQIKHIKGSDGNIYACVHDYEAFQELDDSIPIYFT